LIGVIHRRFGFSSGKNRTTSEAPQLRAVGEFIISRHASAEIVSLSLGREQAPVPADIASAETMPAARRTPGEPKNFSASNSVSVLLGQESPDDGLIHLADERDGRTTIENLDGVPCRYLNRKVENKSVGYDACSARATDPRS
jgi:hypothetical protein